MGIRNRDSHSAGRGVHGSAVEGRRRVRRYPGYVAGKPGRHLALNGHIDAFPVGDGAGWTRDPWGAELVDGKIYGRGACDMKCGTTAAIFTFLYLRELRGELHGKLTLSAVSDEETFGP